MSGGKPLNYDKDRPSINISSSTVIWNGPDIPCIDLCNGEVIDQIIYDLATELCQVLTWLDVNSYDLSCFNLGNCKPKDFQQLEQFILDKLCSLQQAITNINNNPESINCNLTCPVTLPTCFNLTNPLPLFDPINGADAVHAIANKICDLVQTITTIQTAITTINTQIQNLTTTINNLVSSVSIPPLVLTSCTSGWGCTSVHNNNTLAFYADVINCIYVEVCSLYGQINNIGSTTITNPLTCSNVDSTLASILLGSPTQYTGWLPATSLNGFINDVGLLLCDIKNSLISFLQNQCVTNSSPCWFLEEAALIAVPNLVANNYIITLVTPGSLPPGYTFNLSTGIAYDSLSPINSHIISLTALNTPSVLAFNSSPILGGNPFVVSIPVTITSASGASCCKVFTIVVNNSTPCIAPENLTVLEKY